MVVGPDSIDFSLPDDRSPSRIKSLPPYFIVYPDSYYSFLHRSRQPRLGGNYGQATRSDERGFAPQGVDGSRMSREIHVRFWEGVGVRFPHATRLWQGHRNVENLYLIKFHRHACNAA